MRPAAWTGLSIAQLGRRQRLIEKLPLSFVSILGPFPSLSPVLVLFPIPGFYILGKNEA